MSCILVQLNIVLKCSFESTRSVNIQCFVYGMDGWLDGWMMDGWRDRWIDEWMDGWVGEWMGGQAGICYQNYNCGDSKVLPSVTCNPEARGSLWDN